MKNYWERINKIGVALLFLSGLFLRLWQLNSIPVSYYHDEIDYVFTGATVAQTGADITGQWSPWQLRPLQTYNFTAELPALFQAWVQSFTTVGTAQGHLTSALFGLLTVAITAAISWTLWRQKRITVAITLILLLNPWHVYISRLSYEVVISLFWQIVFVLGLVKSWQVSEQSTINSTTSSKGNSSWKTALLGRYTLPVVLMILGLTLGYFTYHGAKLTLILVSLGGVVTLYWPEKIKSYKHDRARIGAAIAVLSTIAVLGLYSWWLTTKGWYGGRESEFIWNLDFLHQQVSAWRTQSLHWPGQYLVLNEVTILIWEGIKRYLSVFDVYRLFISGYESGWQFSLAVHGFWYLSSLIWLPWGIVQFSKKQPRLFKKWLLLLLVSPVTTAVSLSYQSIFRSALTYWLLLIVVGYGLAQAWEQVKKWNGGRVLVISCLLAQVIWFATQYFGHYPIVSSENHYYDHELLAAYVQKTNRPLEIWVETDAYQFARSLVFYNQLQNSLTNEQKQQFIHTDLHRYQLPQVTVLEGCPTDKNHQLPVILQEGIYKNCGYPKYLATAAADLQEIRSLSSPRDSRGFFFLLPDTVCPDFIVKSFIHPTDIKLFNPHQLNQVEFCSTWLKTEKISRK